MANAWLLSPFVHLCLLCIPGLLLAAIYAGMSDPPGREAGRRRRGCGQGNRRMASPAARSPGLPTRWAPGAELGRELFPVRELEAGWSAERSARFSQALGRLRMPEPTGRRAGASAPAHAGCQEHG
jgi:hypothetical protein